MLLFPLTQYRRKMAKTYKVNAGSFTDITGKATLKYYGWNILFLGKKFLLHMCSFLLTLGITFYVFQNCITSTVTQDGIMITLSECISLGSIFATFGSALIAVFSLYSAQQLSSFEEKISIMYEEFSKQNYPCWKRWEFLPRYSREKLSNGDYKYFRLRNASLYFVFEQKELSVVIPTVRKDFIDLPILRNWFRLCIHKRKYISYVYMNECRDELVIWNCLHSIYNNIVLYRFCQFAVWIGSSFVINSIIHAFFYEHICPII